MRILGPTGGLQTAGLVVRLEGGSPALYQIGDAILTGTTECDMVEGGVLRVDWTLLGSIRILGNTPEELPHPDSYPEVTEDEIVIETDQDLLDFLDSLRIDPEEEDEDPDEYTI